MALGRADLEDVQALDETGGRGEEVGGVGVEEGLLVLEVAGAGAPGDPGIRRGGEDDADDGRVAGGVLAVDGDGVGGEDVDVEVCEGEVHAVHETVGSREDQAGDTVADGGAELERQVDVDRAVGEGEELVAAARLGRGLDEAERVGGEVGADEDGGIEEDGE